MSKADITREEIMREMRYLYFLMSTETIIMQMALYQIGHVSALTRRDE